jgi:hypothetical protein
MRKERNTERPKLLWLLLAAVAAPGAIFAYQGYHSREAAPPAAGGLLAEDATRIAAARVLSPNDGPGLSLELSTLRNAVAEERARLLAFRQTREELETRIDGLRMELAAMESRRDTLSREVRFEGAPAPARMAEAASGGAAEPRDPPANGDVPWSGPSTPAMASAGGGRGAQGDAEPTGPEVVIHHRAGSAQARRAAELVAEEVRRAGIVEVQFRPMQNVPRNRMLRTFREEDAAVGERMAARFRTRWSHPWTVEAPRRAADGEALNLVEIWLPH